MNIGKDHEDSLARVNLANQLADSLLSKKERETLKSGSRVYQSLLEEIERKNQGMLPLGAEEKAVEKANEKVPGYAAAFNKWTELFSKTLNSGQG